MPSSPGVFVGRGQRSTSPRTGVRKRDIPLPPAPRLSCHGLTLPTLAAQPLLTRSASPSFQILSTRPRLRFSPQVLLSPPTPTFFTHLTLPEIASKLPFSCSQSNRPLLEKLYHSPASMDHSNKLDSIKKLLSQWKGRGSYTPIISSENYTAPS